MKENKRVYRGGEGERRGGEERRIPVLEKVTILVTIPYLENTE